MASVKFVLVPLVAAAISTTAVAPLETDAGGETSEYHKALTLVESAGYIDADGNLVPSAIAGIDSAEYLDLASLADAYDLSIEGAIKKWHGSVEFSAAQDTLAQEFAGSFAYAEWDNGRGRIILTGEIPESAVEKLRAASPGVVVALDNELPSQAEIDQESERLSLMISGSTVRIDYPTAALTVMTEAPVQEKLQKTATDSVDSRISITFLQHSQVGDSEKENVQKRTSRSDPQGRFVPTDSLLRGGALVNQQDAMSSFTLRSSTGAYRMGTCAHCVEFPDGPNGKVSYKLHPIDGGTSTFLNVYHPGNPDGMDLATLTHGGRTPSASFYVNSTTKRSALSRRTSHVPIGSPICHHRRSNPSDYCDTAFVTQSEGGVTYMTASRDISDGGDSGGPWFYSRTAIGVHTGQDDVTRTSRYISVHNYGTQYGYYVLLGS